MFVLNIFLYYVVGKYENCLNVVTRLKETLALITLIHSFSDGFVPLEHNHTDVRQFCEKLKYFMFHCT